MYKGKTVRFKGQVLKNKYFKDKNFVPGRKVMTCCAEDTSFIGYISFYDKISSLENRQWITVTAQIAYEFQMAYKKKGPVLYVQKVEPAEAPAETEAKTETEAKAEDRSQRRNGSKSRRVC